MILFNLEVLMIPLSLIAGCIAGIGYYCIHTHSIMFLKVAKGALYSFFYPNKKTIILITSVRVKPCEDILKLFKGTHIHVKEAYVFHPIQPQLITPDGIYIGLEGIYAYIAKVKEKILT